MSNGNILEVAKNVEDIIFGKVNESVSEEETQDQKVIAAAHEVLKDAKGEIETAEWVGKVITKAFGTPYTNISDIFTSEALSHFAELIETAAKEDGIQIFGKKDTQQNTNEKISEHIIDWRNERIDLWSDDYEARLQLRKFHGEWLGIFYSRKYPEIVKAHNFGGNENLVNLLSTHSISIKIEDKTIRFVKASIEAKKLNILYAL